MATKRQLAGHVGVSVQTVSKLLPILGLPSRGAGIDEFRLAYIAHLREQAAGRFDEDSEYKLMAERARLTHHQANVEALKEAQLEGQLLPCDVVFRTWLGMVANIRARLLCLPAKMAPVLVNRDDITEVEASIKAQVYESLTELSTYGLPPGIDYNDL